MQYNYNQVKEELEKLLHSHKCLTDYKKEFRACNKRYGSRESYEDFLERHCSQGDVVDLISMSFAWDNTENGRSFWQTIDKEWETIVNKTEWKEVEE